MEEEDEESLKTVENGEDVSHEDGPRVNVEETEQPRQTKQDDQHECTFQPRTIHRYTRVTY